MPGPVKLALISWTAPPSARTASKSTPIPTASSASRPPRARRRRRSGWRRCSPRRSAPSGRRGGSRACSPRPASPARRSTTGCATAFEQHCALFHQRPFVWHIWDGRRDGFHALVNYHRLAAPGGAGERTLEKLIYSYLGDWITLQRNQQRTGTEGADARLAHAEHLRAELEKILEGEPPYDIFVRWKPLHQQPIGWEPDINDGVRLNIRPFLTARTLANRSRSASILRFSPKIKWEKDRGKEPTRAKEDYPWFWSWPADDPAAATDFAGGATFDGNRWNNLHYTRAFKQTARERKGR
ncbi:MAG TPA: hypothetical protein VFZ16_21260 [Hyphomicrobiaceae bacterium]|nr:hypothetical protein [Hyphomicrobiaceae bacterium]